MTVIELNCWILGDDAQNGFAVKIPTTESVSTLKEMIKEKNHCRFERTDAATLVLWKVSIAVAAFEARAVEIRSREDVKALDGATELRPFERLSSVFSGELIEGLHVIVLPPAVTSRTNINLAPYPLGLRSAPPPVAPQPRERVSTSKPTATTSAASASRHPADATTSGQPSAQPEVALITKVSTTPAKTPLARKRKVSFDFGDGDASDGATERRSGPSIAHPEATRSTKTSTTPARGPVARKRPVPSDRGTVTTSDKPAEQHALAQPIAMTPTVSAKTLKSPGDSRLEDAEEPPKKKRKKESTRTKEVETTETIKSSSIRALAPKTKPKKTVEMSAPKDVETSEPMAKKPRKQKKDDSTSSKKPSALVDQDGMDQSISQPSISVIETPLQSVIENPAESSAEGGTLKTRKNEKTKAPTGTACAAIPQTSASVSVQSEVSAAIWSSYLSKASETIPPKTPAKRKSIRRDTKRSIVSSNALPGEPTTVLDPPADEIPNIPTEYGPEQVALTDEPPRQTPDLNGPSCPICSGEPFHIRYYCPIVQKGPDAIQERLEELKRKNMGDQQSLIKQLEGLLCDSKVASVPSLDVALTDDVQSSKVSPPPNASLPRTLNVPSNSYLSEVTVENRDEGSSSESSDEMLDGRERQELSAPQIRKMPDKQTLPSDDDLEVIIRGPTPKRQSVLNLLDLIIGDEDDEDSGTEENEAKLEEDPDEETGRSRRRSSGRVARSPDSESEEEESKSPSPSRSVEDTSNNRGPAVQSPNKPTEDSVEHQGGEVVMKDPADPPALEGLHDDSSEETHVGSEDHMVLDESTGEKGAAIVAEEQPSSLVPRASLLQPLNNPSNERQESAKTQVDPAPGRDGNEPPTSEVLGEAEADPIEPADDLTSPTGSRRPNTDSIEAHSDDIGSLFASVTQSTPRPGVSKRIKTRNGETLDNEAERPVLLKQLAAEATEQETPVQTRGKSRRKVTEMPASQEPPVRRRSPRFSSVPSAASTPATAALLSYKLKSGTQTGKATKMPAKGSDRRSDALNNSAKGDAMQNEVRLAPTPSLVGWETLAEPSSPFGQLDELALPIDELMSSSPQPNDVPVRRRLNEKTGRPRKLVTSSQAESSQRKERLFDLSSSQIPFPYSQNLANPELPVLSNGKGSEGATDSEEEPKVVKKRTIPVRYRSLSQLASESFFSPSFPTPVNKSVTNAKATKRAADEDSSSSSSSSSDEDEANGSEHIPRGRRAGSALETKKSHLSKT